MSRSAQPKFQWKAEDVEELARIRETVDAATNERMLREFAAWFDETRGDTTLPQFPGNESLADVYRRVHGMDAPILDRLRRPA